MAYIYHTKTTIHVGRYTSPMDGTVGYNYRQKHNVYHDVCRHVTYNLYLEMVGYQLGDSNVNHSDHEKIRVEHITIGNPKKPGWKNGGSRCCFFIYTSAWPS